MTSSGSGAPQRAGVSGPPSTGDGVRLDYLPAPAALLDQSGVIEAVNEAWSAEMPGHPLLPAVGKSFIDAVTTVSGSRRAADEIRGVLSAKGKSFTLDIASGGEGARWFRMLASGREGGGGSVVLVDTTDHHRAAELLREHEERLRQAVETVEDYAIFTLDRAGRVATWNRGAERITGHRTDDIVGRQVSVLYPEEERKAGAPERALAGAAAGGRYAEEGWRTREDGTLFWGSMTVTAMRDSRGELRGFLQVLRDLTERRRAEVALSDSRARLESIIESAMDAIITVDGSQRIVMFNKSAERIFGVPAQEAIGGPLDRFIPQRFRGSHDAYVRSFGKTGVTMRGMGRLGTLSGVRADGSEFPIEASISQATVAGDRFYTVILRDISERQRLEGQLLQAQKMEGIGRLAGGVAHDFNNLLMAMFNYLQLATRKLEPGHPALSNLEHVREAAERASSLTRQLLAFARKQVVSTRVVSPREVARNLEPMLRRLIGEDVTLRSALAPDTGNIKADVSQLEQVIVNLVVNARDAMPQGGTLALETGNIELDEAYCRTRVGAVPGPHVMIVVSDTGVGMSPDVMARLFEPFFTTKPPGKGTGLGLATCHGIVRQSGGHIAVYSEPGRGTSVKVFLPRVLERATAGPAEAPAGSPRGGNETILLAEDSQTVRTLAADALTEVGYTLLIAEDGEKAAALAADYKNAIDLVVTDVVMPGLNGVQLVQQLLRTRPNLRAIYMSGYTEETVGHHGVETEREAFLAKPFMTDLLLRKVRDVLDAGKAARPDARPDA